MSVDDEWQPKPSLEPQATEAAQVDAAAILVTTDTLELQISTAGGTLTSAVLIIYPVAKDRPDEKVNLLGAEQDTLAVIQSGLRSRGGGADVIHQESFSVS